MLFTFWRRGCEDSNGDEREIFEQTRYEKVDWDCESEEQDDAFEEVHYNQPVDKPRASQHQLTIIYILFLAEAIMASSLQSQLKMLITKDDFCGNLSTSYLESILECAYAVGSVAGLFWGWMSDRRGRRPVALVGVSGMALCCIGMGFATDLLSCTIFRVLAGLVSSSIAVTTLTMIGDISHSPAERAKNISRLPLIALCGSVGPLVQRMVSNSIKANDEIWGKFPILSGQIACGVLVLLITMGTFLLLEETLPGLESGRKEESIDIDCEKAAFLGETLDESERDTAIRVLGVEKPDPISICQILRAPSLVVLLASYSLLSLHSATFDQLLPHLGHSSTRHGGMGIPCSILGLIVTVVSLVAGIIILLTAPGAVARLGLLRPYRLLSTAFPAIYMLTPVLTVFTTCSPASTALIAILSILVKKVLHGSAGVFVALLVLNASPDAFSTGTIVGLMQSASLFKALAVAVSGASFFLSNDFSVVTTNGTLWSALALFSVLGAALAWFVRDHPVVGQDFPVSILKWETCFDAAAAESAEMVEEA
ncbi:hypothetical protein FGG08_000853 [Glutinoglossum americanum]|uniref:Major facilitator superfamily (MFS) profile domain-containing protein n=1 Tax=Glutinoglossum americanum TaxID=1670608 RepID=A0A9P8L6M2_9PEZI|nr:hypothetical protein FGG08_000853 [Glutinoglossum americanum]